ncbi:nadph-dependent aldehyde reductase-like protein [Quercus suber]|uniref:Nadph-dependent aldehyde reductase-like protein n=1 Tax=Quercus suber TaxID=58331 RepID=A0AAW0JJP6_QUESU
MCLNQPRSSPSSTKPRSYSTRLDILVNSPGVTDTKLPSIANASLEDFDRIFRNEEYVKRVINNCPLGRLKETRDVALVVGFLATDASKWINGQVVRVSGGYI